MMLAVLKPHRHYTASSQNLDNFTETFFMSQIIGQHLQVQVVFRDVLLKILYHKSDQIEFIRTRALCEVVSGAIKVVCQSVVFASLLSVIELRPKRLVPNLSPDH